MAQKVTDTVCLVFKQQFTTTVEKQTSKQAYKCPNVQISKKSPFSTVKRCNRQISTTQALLHCHDPKDKCFSRISIGYVQKPEYGKGNDCFVCTGS